MNTLSHILLLINIGLFLTFVCFKNPIVETLPLLTKGVVTIAAKCFPILLFIQISKSDKAQWLKKLNTLAFIFCGGGDLFLEIRKFDVDRVKLHFILGICSFMIAQLIFAYLFSLRLTKDNKLEYSPLSIFSWIPFLVLLYPVMSIILVSDKLSGGIFYAVIFYGIAISSMGWRAFVRSGENYGYIRLIGSLVFIYSDTCIALGAFTDLYQKWEIPSNLVSFVIMSTYWIALYCFMFSFYACVESSDMSHSKNE